MTFVLEIKINTLLLRFYFHPQIWSLEVDQKYILEGNLAIIFTDYFVIFLNIPCSNFVIAD